MPPARLIGADLTYRLYLALYLIGVPLAMLWMVTRRALSPWPSLLVFPLLYSFPLAYGFVTYLVGTAVVLCGLPVLERWLEQPTRRGLAGIAGLGLAIFALHPQAWGYWAMALVGLGLLWAIRQPGDWRNGILLQVSSVPPIALALVFILARLDFSDSSGAGEPGLRERFLDLPANTLLFWTEPLFFGLVFTFAAIATVALLDPRRARLQLPASWSQSLWHHRYLLFAGALLAGGLLAPERLGDQFFVASRFPSMAVLLLPLILAGAAAWQGRLVPALTSATVAALGLLLLLQFMGFHAESSSFSQVIERIPEGARYRCQIDDPQSDLSIFPVYRHFCSHILASRGGLNGFLFRSEGVDFKKPYQVPQSELYYWQAAPTRRFDFAKYGNLYDYYVVRSSERHTPYDPGQPLAPFFKRLFAQGKWRVYQRTHAFEPR